MLQGTSWGFRKNQLILREFGHHPTPWGSPWLPLFPRRGQRGRKFRGLGWISGIAVASPVPLVGPERPNSWGWAGFWGPHPYESTEDPLSCQTGREPQQLPRRSREQQPGVPGDFWKSWEFCWELPLPPHRAGIVTAWPQLSPLCKGKGSEGSQAGAGSWELGSGGWGWLRHLWEKHRRM